MADTNDWATGDCLGLAIPAHAGALQAGGAEWLTDAFRACGSIDAANRVGAITALAEFPGGSTGRKLRLSVDYAQDTPDLRRDLFVKFSRDFDNPLRDRARFQMEREVRFALLSTNPEFPIEVPDCYAADFNSESGTGILITSQIPFGQRGIEQQHQKCRDDDLADSLPYYRALVTALARLAGTQRSGRLGDDLEQQFPFNPSELAVSPRNHYTAEQVSRRIARLASFADAHPRLLPESVRAPDFLQRFHDEGPALIRATQDIEDHLARQSDYLALGHWNANIDNAWFWRDAHGGLACGLFDWGNVSVMPLAMALWGCLSGAGTGLWDDHLEELLALYAREYRTIGGPDIDPVALQRQLLLHARLMGLNWLLDVPALLQDSIPDLAEVSSRKDPRIRENEAARTRLQMLTVFLNLWASRDPGPLPPG